MQKVFDYFSLSSCTNRSDVINILPKASTRFISCVVLCVRQLLMFQINLLLPCSPGLSTFVNLHSNHFNQLLLKWGVIRIHGSGRWTKKIKKNCQLWNWLYYQIKLSTLFFMWLNFYFPFKWKYMYNHWQVQAKFTKFFCIELAVLI